VRRDRGALSGSRGTGPPLLRRHLPPSGRQPRSVILRAVHGRDDVPGDVRRSRSMAVEIPEPGSLGSHRLGWCRLALGGPGMDGGRACPEISHWEPRTETTLYRPRQGFLTGGAGYQVFGRNYQALG